MNHLLQNLYVQVFKNPKYIPFPLYDLDVMKILVLWQNIPPSLEGSCHFPFSLEKLVGPKGILFVLQLSKQTSLQIPKNKTNGSSKIIE